MRISTKGHYAVQAMVDMAMQGALAPVSLSVIAERQDLSQNYLEQLFVKLRKADLVKSVRGPGGGYMLVRHPEAISIGDIFSAVEENLVLTDCVDQHGAPHSSCSKSSECRTQALWSRLGQHFNELLYSITLADVLKGEFDFSAVSSSRHTV
ncbi:MAG: Rrf2 family transcriptional regulator [Nitrospinae bacterium]|nr:Rrf2 family transcriptional regulator [Nitrospinota bacterium]